VITDNDSGNSLFSEYWFAISHLFCAHMMSLFSVVRPTMWQRVIIFSCLLWVLTEAGAPCGLQLECVPQGLCGLGSWILNAGTTQTHCQRWETCCHISQVV